MLTFWLAMQAHELDSLFTALANARRRAMIDVLRDQPGATIADFARRLGISGVGALKHVRVLEQAGLIVSRVEGRKRRLYFNIMPIHEVYEQWTDQYSRFWGDRVADIKAALESQHQSTDSRKAARERRDPIAIGDKPAGKVSPQTTHSVPH